METKEGVASSRRCGTQLDVFVLAELPTITGTPGREPLVWWFPLLFFLPFVLALILNLICLWFFDLSLWGA